MPLYSSETRPLSHTVLPHDDGPRIECATLEADAADQTLGIRAHRHYPVSRHDLFSAWTRHTAWDSWMRLRARSRSTLAPYAGGALRLELADGPTIHVITGTVIEIRAGERLSLSWVHHGMSDQPSIIDLNFHDKQSGSELEVVHRQIASRREAAWLMRLWTTVLDGLASYLNEGRPAARRISDRATTLTPSVEPEARRPSLRGTLARSAGIAFTVLGSTLATLGAANAHLTVGGKTWSPGFDRLLRTQASDGPVIVRVAFGDGARTPSSTA